MARIHNIHDMLKISNMNNEMQNAHALFAHEKLALLGLSCNALPDAYNPRPH